MAQAPYWGSWGGNALLQYLINSRALWVAAHHADPTPAGLLSTEFAGDGYVRAAYKGTAPSGRALVNSVGFGWHGLPGGLISHFALWTDISSGSLVLVHPLPNPITIPVSGHCSVAKGDWAITV